MPTSSILIAGHSHVAALGVPLLGEGYELRQVPNGALPVFGLVGGWPREDTDYWKQVALRAEGRTVAIFWRGNQHFHHFLVMPDRGFDFLVDSAPHLAVEPSVPTVPEATVIEFMRADMADLDPVIKEIKAAGGRVVLCGTPPPKGDAAFVRERILHEKYFRKVAEDLGVDLASIGISSPLLLYKLWVVMQNSLADVARRHGVLFMPVPDRLRDSGGFLHPDYYAGDVTHSNHAYGALMLEDLATFVSSGMEASVEQ
ncbi:hypothetical protein [Rhizobium sp.]